MPALRTLVSSPRFEILLVAIAVLTRLPFRAQILHQWDSVNFALALERYDLTLHQPHPPGMFVLYVFAGRMLDKVVGDPNAALVTLSLLASAASAVLLFWLGRAWFDREIGAIAAFLFLSSPLMWFQSEVALSYMPECFWVLAIAIACGAAGGFVEAPPAVFYLSALLVGASSGIRPNTLFFLFPLWVFVALLGVTQGQYRRRELAIAIVCGLAGIACWLVPMVVLSGGPEGLYRAMQPWLADHPKDGVGRSLLDDDVSSLHGIYLNFKLLVEAILYAVGFGIFPILWLGFRRWRQLLLALQTNRIAQFLLVWIVPGVAYLIFVHIKRLGHAMTILPVVLLMASLAIADLSRFLTPKQRALLPAVICLLNAAFFLFGPANWTATVPTRATIAQYDAYIGDRVAAIRERFPPNSLVLTSGRNGRIREFYLPEYFGTGLGADWQTFTGDRVPPAARHLILFDDTVLAEADATPAFSTLALPTGTLRYLTWSDEETLVLAESSVAIAPR